MDDKVKLNTLNMMEKLDKAYMMTTSKSPVQVAMKSRSTNASRVSRTLEKKRKSQFSTREDNLSSKHNIQNLLDNDSQFERQAGESVVFSSENAIILEESKSRQSNVSFNAPSNHTVEKYVP